MSFKVIRSPFFRPSELTTARRYEHLADALRDMGEGLVLGEDGHLAAFHERHLALLTRRGGAL